MAFLFGGGVLTCVPFVSGLPRAITEDNVYKNMFIPKGTLVMVNIWDLLHDPKTYADPMTFNPDRFIATPGREAERDPRDFAFGFGRRCVSSIGFRASEQMA